MALSRTRRLNNLCHRNISACGKQDQRLVKFVKKLRFDRIDTKRDNISVSSGQVSIFESGLRQFIFFVFVRIVVFRLVRIVF